MRTKNSVLSIGALLTIAGCAGTTPKQTAGGLQPDELATYAGGRVTKDDWAVWKKTSQIPTTIARDEEARQFSEYLQFRIDSLAARDAGITKDSALQRRWLSVRQRILSERFRVDVLNEQFGVDDTAITKYLASHPEMATLPTDSARAKAVRAIALQGIKIDSVYETQKDMYKRDSVQLPLDSVREQIVMALLRERTDRLTRELPDMLRKLYKVEQIVPERPEPPLDTLKAMYKATANARFSSPAIFHMRALGAKDSASLAKALAKVKDEAGFKALAAKFPVGTPVAPEGDLGRVKRQLALPYGIGLVPQLFNELEPARTGFVAPLKVADNSWMAFWVAKVDSGDVRPFDEVKSDLREEFFHANPWTPAPATVLCKWDRGPLFTQSDVDFIYEEIPAHVRRQYPTNRILDFMSLWAVVARASEETGHLARADVQKAVLDNQRIYWSQEWRKSSNYQTFGVSKAKADSAFAASASLFTNGVWIDSVGGVNRDAARLAIMPANYLQARFAEDIDRYRQDTVFAKFDSVKGQVFRDNSTDLDAKGRAYQDSTLKARYSVKLASSAPGEAAAQAPAARLDTARSLHDRRSLDDAQKLYESVESDVSAPDSLRAQALFQLGQLYGEQQAFPRSLSRYRAVLARFPKSGEAYKAQFMIAFTYSEYLKEEKVALKEYRKVLANYPKCDLADDADWMIRNIESGGALMPKFDDIDSTIKDSVKAPVAKDSASKPATPAAAPAKTVVDTAKAAASKPAAATTSSASAATKPASDAAKAKAAAAAKPSADSSKAKSVATKADGKKK